MPGISTTRNRFAMSSLGLDANTLISWTHPRNDRQLGKRLLKSFQLSFEKAPVRVNESKTQVDLQHPHWGSADFVSITTWYSFNLCAVIVFLQVSSIKSTHFAGQRPSIFYEPIQWYNVIVTAFYTTTQASVRFCYQHTGYLRSAACLTTTRAFQYKCSAVAF